VGEAPRLASASRWLWAAGALGGLAIAATIGGQIHSKRQLAAVQPLPPPPESLGTRPGGLLIIGDSRVAQWPIHSIPGDGVAVGFPGATAISIAAVAPAIYARVRPHTVVVQAGFNDASAAALAFGKERDAIVASAARAIVKMAIDARTSGAERVIVMTVVPAIRPELSRRLLYGSRHDAAIAALNDRIGHIVMPGVVVLQVEPLLRDKSGHLDPKYRADAAHWTAVAYRRIGYALGGLLDARPPR
jgi:hypothetical protein